MIHWIWPLLTGLGLLLALSAAVGAKALRHFSHYQLEVYSRLRKNSSRFGGILDYHDEAALAAEKLLALGLVLLLGGGCFWWQSWKPSDDPRRAALLLAGLFVLTLAVTVWLPWAVSKYWSAPFLYRTWPAWFLLYRISQPLLVGTRFFDGLIRRLSGQREEDRRADEEEAFESEIMTMVTAGQREGLLEEDAREMIEGVFELDDADVAEIMTPRSQVDMLDIHWPWPQVLQHVIRTRRTRLPVFDRHRDDIIGVLHVKDLLPELAKAPSEDKRPLRTLLRRPWFVPRSKPVDDLLQEFLDNRQHLAIVVDEYHAVAGVVTIEDVLEEIVGEIVDEFDRHEEPVERIQRLNETQVEVDGAVHVDELNEELGLDLPESDEFDTIAGLVISQLGYIPAVGESLQTNGVRITVAAANGRRLQKVIVETASDASNEPV